MTPSVVPNPPSPFPKINKRTLKSGTELHRNHLSSFGATQFNPCLGQATCFAPFNDRSGKCVPTLYAATSREAAAFESIFHDVDPAALFKSVRLSTVERRSVSIIAPKRNLMLASLFAPDLKAWRLSRTDLIETPKSTYAETVLWAQAIHASSADVDGLIWTSRQCDPEQCLILFEDRIAEVDLEIRDRLGVASNAALLLELRDYGWRAGITIIS
ncbi:RES domain-containing protein (plasmid) [Rhizobium sp. WL3]|uniref:RES family NAD+ phosphorylase n=1 Tax=Rhizobium sp. WL3 TaxID=2603277 RepID=UPI0011C207A9|nr:RES family NAD+ phosphorylase [Rhizobium sp. WL3]QEE43614.1 RES domain-containing protein [Rhizobium sp. WL3]